MFAIRLENISKVYTHYANAFDRLREVMTKRRHHQAFQALYPLTLEVPHGQVVGIVGDNGAGKSTLLKLIVGTLQADGGKREVHGRIGALLELGGGFHLEMSGRENVFLSGAMMGLRQDEIEALYPSIVRFAGVEAFMDQPVKTYSSGMFMRLAFAVATSAEPDILVVDEALSVGDGAFARKSFDRIMKFKEQGKTILFCSHSLYQVEAICDRALWLDKGRVRMDAMAAEVVNAYTLWMEGAPVSSAEKEHTPTVSTNRLLKLRLLVNGQEGQQARSGQDEVGVEVTFHSDPQLPIPSVALMFVTADGRPVCSAGSYNDGFGISRDESGHGQVTVRFPRFGLLRGEYLVNVYLLCESAIHLYDQSIGALQLVIDQQGMERGLVSLPRTWDNIASTAL